MSDVQPKLVSHFTITRTSSDDLQQRDVIVALDGDEIARLMHRESVTFEISPGHHRLRVDNTWNRKTVDFNAAPGDHPKFFVTNAGSLSQFLKFTFDCGPTYVEISDYPETDRPCGLVDVCDSLDEMLREAVSNVGC